MSHSGVCVYRVANKMNKRRGAKKSTWLDDLFVFTVSLFPFLAPNASSRRSANTNGTSVATKGGSAHSKTNSVAPIGGSDKQRGGSVKTGNRAPSTTDADNAEAQVLPAQSSKLSTRNGTVDPQRRLSLRWTGQLMNETESKKMFQAIMSVKENPVEEVVEVLPDKFEVVTNGSEEGDGDRRSGGVLAVGGTGGVEMV